VHDGVPTDHGTILYLSASSRVVTNFPTSSTNPNAPLLTASVEYDRVIELSATNGTVLNTWSLIDMLQPTRIDYLTFVSRNANGWDGEHVNALLEDPSDNSIIVSLRNQDAVIKFSRATGKLKWILGPHENWGAQFQPYLLTPVGGPFQWNYAQHGPMLTPQGTLVLYDNGNFRASPFAASVPDASNYSRAVEFQISQDTMTVTQVWQYGSQTNGRLYTPSVGNADWLPQRGNVLATFGNVTYVNGVSPSRYSTNASLVRIIEATHDPVPQVVFDLAVFDYANTNSTYRGYCLPVADLTVMWKNEIPSLDFSADPARTYVVEASTDMVYGSR
ncbi:MAG: aryl-sulfate sulfotransferase, partial [Verrucomicrobia bacterium]|nr:aryl-sulfate sulfotransferase [Verrucomicrobiota bacterium]